MTPDRVKQSVRKLPEKKFSTGLTVQTDETLDRLWASGQHDLVEQHLLKGKNNGAAAAKLIAFQKHEITALREEVAEAGAQCRKQETRARELERLLEEVEEHRAMEDKQRAKQEKKTIEEALLRAQAAEAMAAVEKEKRLLLEAALNKLLREWETRQVDLLVTHPTSPEP